MKKILLQKYIVMRSPENGVNALAKKLNLSGAAISKMLKSKHRKIYIVIDDSKISLEEDTTKLISKVG